jgi:hypothetical protein
LSGTTSLIIILTTLLKRVAGVVRAAKVVIVYVPRSNKGHPSIVKTCLLAPLLPLTSTLNTYKLTSKRYLLYGLLALRSRSLPSPTALNHRMTRLAVIPIIRRMVTAIASPITRLIF